MAKKTKPASKKQLTAETRAKKDDLVARLARQGNLDRRSAEDLRETFRSFVGEARALVGE